MGSFSFGSLDQKALLPQSVKVHSEAGSKYLPGRQLLHEAEVVEPVTVLVVPVGHGLTVVLPMGPPGE
jgi:hypothetical protein